MDTFCVKQPDSPSTLHTYYWVESGQINTDNITSYYYTPTYLRCRLVRRSRVIDIQTSSREQKLPIISPDHSVKISTVHAPNTYRPYLSVRLFWSNPLDSTRPFWRATEYALGHSSIPRWHASMHAARRQGVLGVVRCGTRPSSRVPAPAPPVPHLLRGGYKRGLHAFQGGQRHHGSLGTPEEEKRGGGAGGSNCQRVSPGDAALEHAVY